MKIRIRAQDRKTTQKPSQNISKYSGRKSEVYLANSVWAPCLGCGLFIQGPHVYCKKCRFAASGVVGGFYDLDRQEQYDLTKFFK